MLCCTPGLLGKFEDAWQGPFKIMKRVSAVNYLLHWEDDRHRHKVVHINRLKRFQERKLEVGTLTVVANDHGIEDDLARLKDY